MRQRMYNKRITKKILATFFKSDFFIRHHRGNEHGVFVRGIYPTIFCWLKKDPRRAQLLVSRQSNALKYPPAQYSIEADRLLFHLARAHCPAAKLVIVTVSKGVSMKFAFMLFGWEQTYSQVRTIKRLIFN
jgi:hypothetical protein